MSFGEKIMDYKADILADLSELISIESVAESPSECARALKWMTDKAESFGLSTKTIEGKAGHVELGDGGKLCGVLSHLDVVPSGNNWNSLPFELSVDEGYMYGRGIADDKGASLISLYCLKALKDNNVVGKNRLRCIYGIQEETGMTDLMEYFKHEEKPELAFTPDLEYGICNSEKGILHLEIYADNSDGTTLTQFHSGKAVNAVPDTAYALLDCTENEDHQLMRLADARKGDFDFYYTIDGLMAVSHGTAAHGSKPNEGLNAAMNLISLLSSNFSLPSLGSIATFLDSYIGDDIYGTLLGIKSRDNQSGPLTVNVGTVHIDDGYATCTLDIRYPATQNSKEILEKINACAAKEKLKVKVLEDLAPLYVKEDSEIITILSKAYKEIEGVSPHLFSTGGGTYSRLLDGNCVAFGPLFPGESANVHNANEKINVEKFFKHAQICLEAMYKLYTEG